MIGNNCKILVTDFDGTLTQRDVYLLIADRLLGPDTPDFWAEYRAGRITHFEALRGYLAAATAGEQALRSLLPEAQLEPNLAAVLADLRAGGWDVVVVSAGCGWYIDRILADAGVSLPIVANPGRIREDGRLWMELPTDSPYFSPTVGVDKSAVVRAYQAKAQLVAFAGDGPPDLGPALLVPRDLRFARAGSLLANMLDDRAVSYQAFHHWTDVARTLLERPEGQGRTV